MPAKKDAAYYREYRARKAARPTDERPPEGQVEDPRNVPLEAMLQQAVIREAVASVALDKDEREGTHSLDDGCPGGHRDHLEVAIPEAEITLDPTEEEVEAAIRETGQVPSKSVRRRVRAQMEAREGDVRQWRNPYDDGLPDWPELIQRLRPAQQQRLLDAMPWEKRRGS